jgi:SagB-type dehydrogenase family enzyme
MKDITLGIFLFVVLFFPLYGCSNNAVMSATPETGSIALPAPQKDSDTSLEEALQNRRSVRSYSTQPLTLEQAGQLLWAAQGVTGPNGQRTAPSAGAIYPLKVYVVIGNVDNIAPGLYVYEPSSHSLMKLKDGDLRGDLAKAAMNQSAVRQAAADFVITGNYDKISAKYGDRAERFTDLEAGHAAQNLCLQAVGLKLGAVTIGSFYDSDVQEFLGAPKNETPLYILPVGNPAN